MRALIADGAPLDPRLPVIDPDDIAEEIGNLVIDRVGVEVILLTPPQS